MSADANTALVSRYYEDLWNGRDIGIADALFAPSFRIFPGAEPGPEGVRRFAARLLAVFPDLHVRVEDLFAAEGGRVVARFVIRGTHRGAFLGIPASGTPVEIPEITIWRIEEGAIVERWTVFDVLGAIGQIGARIAPPDIANDQAGT